MFKSHVMSNKMMSPRSGDATCGHTSLHGPRGAVNLFILRWRVGRHVSWCCLCYFLYIFAIYYIILYKYIYIPSELLFIVAFIQPFMFYDFQPLPVWPLMPALYRFYSMDGQIDIYRDVFEFMGWYGISIVKTGDLLKREPIQTVLAPNNQTYSIYNDIWFSIVLLCWFCYVACLCLSKWCHWTMWYPCQILPWQMFVGSVCVGDPSLLSLHFQQHSHAGAGGAHSEVAFCEFAWRVRRFGDSQRAGEMCCAGLVSCAEWCHISFIWLAHAGPFAKRKIQEKAQVAATKSRDTAWSCLPRPWQMTMQYETAWCANTCHDLRWFLIFVFYIFYVVKLVQMFCYKKIKMQCLKHFVPGVGLAGFCSSPA